MTTRLVSYPDGREVEVPVFDDEVREVVSLERAEHISEGETFTYTWATACSLTIEDLNHLINGGMLSISIEEPTCLVYLQKDALTELRKHKE